MKNFKKIAGLLSLSVLSLTSCGPKIPSEWTNGVVWTGKTGETIYNSFSSQQREHTVQLVEAYLPNSWNSTTTFRKENGQFLSNIVDGLVYVDVYNKLVPELATEIPQHKEVDDHYEFEFTIRDDANWVENKDHGRKIVAPVMGVDFVTALEANLNYSNSSQSSYLAGMFIAGANEYNTYTKFQYISRLGYKAVFRKGKYAGVCDPNNDKKGCNTITGEGVEIRPIPNPDTNEAEFHNFIMENKLIGSVSSVEDLAKVKNFERVGVKADGKKVKYILTGKQDYFKTVLTYTPFLPVPTDYYKSNPAYGTTAQNILSNGAYVVNSKYRDGSSTSMILEKNLNYHLKETVKNARVIVRTPTSDGDRSELRKLYESGQIDGFAVNKADSEGWKKYVEGEDGKGTIANPSHKDAYAVESVGDGSTFAYLINTYRTSYKGSMLDKNAAAKLDLKEEGNNLEIIEDRHGNNIPSAINNTNIALTYSPKLRQAILTSLDPTVYNRFRTLSNDSYVDRKQAVNTWTPHDFIKYDEPALKVDGQIKLGFDYNDFLKLSFVEKEIMANPLETKSDGKTLANLFKSDAVYAQRLVDAANDALGYGGFGGLNMIPEFNNGEFTGFKKSSTNNYIDASGYSVNPDANKHGLGNGAFIAASTSIETSDDKAVWYDSASRDTNALQKLVAEGIKEAEENYKKINGKEYKIKTPIVVEFPGLDFNDDGARNSATTYNMANMMLNGSPIKNESNDDVLEQFRTLGLGNDFVNNKGIPSSEAKILFVKQSKKNMPKDTDYTSIANTNNYNMITSGWGPDYSDPMTYANTLVIDGDMQDAVGTHTSKTVNSGLRIKELEDFVVGDYQGLVEKADKATDSIERARLFADAEIEMLYNSFLIRPVEMKGQGYNVRVSKFFAKSATNVPYGLSAFKYKGYESLKNAIPGKDQKGIYDQLQAIRKGLL